MLHTIFNQIARTPAGRRSARASNARPRYVGLRFADRRGAVGVEFALLAPALCLLVAGMVDCGQLMYQTMEVNAAAQAGAGYAVHNGWGASAIETAVTSATSLSVSATPLPSLVKACITSGAIVTTNGSTCPSGGPPGSYVTVSATATFSPFVAGPGILMPSTISASTTVRIQ